MDEMLKLVQKSTINNKSVLIENTVEIANSFSSLGDKHDQGSIPE